MKVSVQPTKRGTVRQLHSASATIRFRPPIGLVSHAVQSTAVHSRVTSHRIKMNALQWAVVICVLYGKSLLEKRRHVAFSAVFTKASHLFLS
jgi:hypothetical protein